MKRKKKGVGIRPIISRLRKRGKEKTESIVGKATAFFNRKLSGHALRRGRRKRRKES